MAKVRRTFTAGFKLAAIRLLTVTKLSPAEASRQLDIGQNVLCPSRDYYETERGRAFLGNGNLPPSRRNSGHCGRWSADSASSATS